MRTLLRIVSAVLVLCGLIVCTVRCGSSKECSPSTCTTCCTGQGECVAAVSALACGGSGLACVPCTSGYTCENGTCTAPANSGGGAGGGAGGGGGTTGKRVFVTSTTYNGALKSAGSAQSGPAGADALCQAAASAAALGGTWKAWISDGSENALNRIADVGPWFLVGTGEKVFNNKANLQTSPLVAIDHDENGAAVPNNLGNVWTGTASGGTAAPQICFGWTASSTGYTGVTGNSGSTSGWTDSGGTEYCSSSKHLYCFEQ